MNLEQVIDLCERVKIHRPTFKDGNSLWQEWLKYLEKYNVNDVNKSLDKYLKDDVDKRIPAVTELIKDLIPLEQYRINSKYQTNCPICKRVMSNIELEKHFNRCSSINYICRNAKKYFNQKIDKGGLWKLSDEQFEKGYWTFCDKLLRCGELSPLEKSALCNSMNAHLGQEVDGTSFFSLLGNTYPRVPKGEYE